MINNAGRGGHGKHIERDLEDELSMIQLNVSSLVTLAHLVSNDMVSQGSGKILQVGSTAGMIPGANQAVYFATKAFVNSFSRAIDQDVRDKCVPCTVLTPGHVETEFAKAGNPEGTDMVNSGDASARDVAEIGYQAMLDGKLPVINEKKIAFMMRLMPFTPMRTKLKMIEKSESKGVNFLQPTLPRSITPHVAGVLEGFLRTSARIKRTSVG